MKTKTFDDGQIQIMWDRNAIDIFDSYNSFHIYISKDIAKYFIYFTEVLYNINKSMRATHISFHNSLHCNRPSEHITQRILAQLRNNGCISGNYMDIYRKDLILSCFKKCFRTKQEKLELKDIDLQGMPLAALLYIKKGLI